uniref:BAALC binder of MAP3K1 and KLF4 n=1 Tax=Callithrix jacchus TaxID=9483 RepID=A0A2R8M921_CALJA
MPCCSSSHDLGTLLQGCQLTDFLGSTCELQRCRQGEEETLDEGVLEDGLSSNGVPRSTAPGGIPNPEKKTNCETQCPNPQSLSSGPLTQKQNGLRTTEAKRDAKRMSSKEVTINVTDSIQHMDKSRRITKNCVN